MPLNSLLVVDDFTVIFCWPSNPTPFIVLDMLSLSALPELPVISPLTLAVDDRLIPNYIEYLKSFNVV